MTIREMTRDEIADIWQFDRGELVEEVYHFREGRLIAERERHDIPGWSPGAVEFYNPILLDCFDRGGTFYGAFSEEELVGVAALESAPVGGEGDRLQLVYLHLDRSQRKRGLGRTLLEMAAARAAELGASKLYISSAPSRNTVDFYLHLGCRPTADLDPELFELEPEDIHLDYPIPHDIIAGEGESDG